MTSTGAVAMAGATHVAALEQTLRAMPQAVVVIDLEGHVTLWSGAAEALYGWSEAEAMGERLVDLIVPDAARAEAVALRHKAEEGHRFTGPFRLRRKDGREFLAEVMDAPVHDDEGTLVGLIAITRDLSDEVAHAEERAQRDARHAAERVDALVELREQEDRFRRVFDQGPIPGAIVGVDLTIQRVNGAMCRMSGFSPEELMGRTVDDITHPDDRDIDAELIGRMIVGEIADYQIEKRYLCKSGAIVRGRLTASIVRGPDNVPRYAIGLIEDVTERSVTARTIADQQERLAMTLAAGRMAAWEVDIATGRYIVADNLSAVFGIDGLETDESTLEEFLRRVHPEDLDRFLASFHRPDPSGETDEFSLEFRLQKAGVESWIRTQGKFVRDEAGAPRSVRGVSVDVTEQRRHELELTERALTDHLTGLPNRTLLADRLRTAVAAIGRRGRGAAILFIDVDRFKAVNDSLGHRMGDTLLVTLAERLVHAVRPDDTVARIGGDEFVVLCQDLADPAEAVEVAERIFAVLEDPFPLGTRAHQVDVSIGLAHAASPDASADDLLRDADVAMYQAKAAGGARIEVFTPALRDQARRRLDLEDELREALAAGDLIAYFQPVMALGAEEAVEPTVLGFEALVRWHHPTRGIIEPALFIASAEETGLIVPLGEAVLDQACRHLARWRRLPGCAHLTMAVNLSGRQLMEPGVCDKVAATLAAHGVPPEALRLEITESMLMADSVSAATTLQALHDLGVVIAVDDFGTGYSSLLYLRRFPVSILKLDRFFVSGLATNDVDRAIVGSMIDLAHSLGMTAVAEGVETVAQLTALRALGCDQAQGYLWSAPVAVPAAERLLAGP